MDALRTGVFVLFVLPVPVSCKDLLFTEPLTCYLLDGILIIYCIIATALYFREKYSFIQPVVVGVSAANGGIYQELKRPDDADPYQVLEPSKRKKKHGKKKKPQPNPPAEPDVDPYESLVASPSAPPVPSH